MRIDEAHKSSALLATIVSAIALLTNWGIVGYLAIQNDPASSHLWEPIRSHPTISFGILALVGSLTGLVAGMKLSKGWHALAVLNLCTFFLEFLAS